MTSHQTIGTWIEHHARVRPDRVALIFGDTAVPTPSSPRMCVAWRISCARWA